MTERLEKLVEDLGHRMKADDPDAVIGHLIAEEGARTRFTAGTHELRMAGVSATCTQGWRGALQSWCRNANRRIERGRK